MEWAARITVMNVRKGRRPGSRGCAVRLRRERGATLVETALTAMLFLAVVTGLISLCLTAYNRAALRQALHASASLCASGGTMVGLDRTASVEALLRSEAARLGLGLRLARVAVCPTDQQNCSPSTAGTPGELMTITAEIESQILLNTGQFRIDERITFRNEQF